MPQLCDVCTFCGEKSSESKRLYAQTDAAICESCIQSFARMIEDRPSIEVPPERILGDWIKKIDAEDSLEAKVNFQPNGVLTSVLSDGAGSEQKILLYAIEGDIINTVELVACGTKNSGTVKFEADGTLTIHNTSGQSTKFIRSKP